MKKLILFFSLLFLLCVNCETESDENSDENKEGACVYYYYDLDYNFTVEYCTNKEEEYCNTSDETFWENTDCMQEGYTKGCGGKFVAEDKDCPTY